MTDLRELANYRSKGRGTPPPPPKDTRSELEKLVDYRYRNTRKNI